MSKCLWITDLLNQCEITSNLYSFLYFLCLWATTSNVYGLLLPLRSGNSPDGILETRWELNLGQCVCTRQALYRLSYHSSLERSLGTLNQFINCFHSKNIFWLFLAIHGNKYEKCCIWIGNIEHRCNLEYFNI